MQSGAIYSKLANSAVRAFKKAFRGLPAIYWPFVPLAVAISPIWLSIPFTLSGVARLCRAAWRGFRFCILSAGQYAGYMKRAGARACASVRA